MGRKNPNVSQILQNVHEQMKARYGAQGGSMIKEIENAKIIQNFLQQLKNEAYNRKPKNKVEKVQLDIYDAILDSIVLPGNRTVHNLFRRTGNSYKQGYYFEDDISSVIAAVVKLADPNKKVTYKNYQMGQSAGTTSIDLWQEIYGEVEDFKKEIINKTAETFKNNSPKLVFGKIDTIVNEDIINISGRVDFPPGLLEALSHATFTDKSYKSGQYEKNGQIISFGGKDIHLGNSDPYRAILGVMSTLPGITVADFEYVYYAGRNIIMGLDNDPPKESADHVSKHLYHLRYIYELTGAGIIYRGGSGSNQYFGEAKYLIYNNPTGPEIQVVSTAQIISDLIFNEYAPKNPYGAISISKAYVMQLSNK